MRWWYYGLIVKQSLARGMLGWKAIVSFKFWGGHGCGFKWLNMNWLIDNSERQRIRFDVMHIRFESMATENAKSLSFARPPQTASPDRGSTRDSQQNMFLVTRIVLHWASGVMCLCVCVCVQWVFQHHSTRLPLLGWPPRCWCSTVMIFIVTITI